jgi:hypothetical protein
MKRIAKNLWMNSNSNSDTTDAAPQRKRQGIGIYMLLLPMFVVLLMFMFIFIVSPTILFAASLAAIATESARCFVEVELRTFSPHS